MSRARIVPDEVSPRTGCANVEEVKGIWYVGYCKHQQEKKLALDLEREGVNYYLPVEPRTSFAHNRRHTIYPCFFPGYLFFAGGLDDRYKALMTARLLSILEEPNQPKLVSQLRSIQIALDAGYRPIPWKGIAAGRMCEVIAGPLRGMIGRLEAMRENANRCWVVLRLDILGDSNAVDIDRELVEPL